MTFLSLLLAIFKSIPALKSWWDSLVAEYISIEVSNLKKDARDAIKKAINEHDQRDLEKQFGSTKSGETSGHAGSELRDSLPGVLPK